MMHLGDLQSTGHPKLDAAATLALTLCFGSFYIPDLVILTVNWQHVFQNLAICFSIIASILSVNKSTKFIERFIKWLKSKRK